MNTNKLIVIAFLTFTIVSTLSGFYRINTILANIDFSNEDIVSTILYTTAITSSLFACCILLLIFYLS